MNAREELQQVVDRFSVAFDQPEALEFLAELRQDGVLEDPQWQRILEWLDLVMAELNEPKREKKEGEPAVYNLDADPRNADWIRIVRAQRVAGCRMPSWAALWLWWIGYDKEEGPFWKQVRRVARKMGFEEFR